MSFQISVLDGHITNLVRLAYKNNLMTQTEGIHEQISKLCDAFYGILKTDVHFTFYTSLERLLNRHKPYIDP